MRCKNGTGDAPKNLKGTELCAQKKATANGGLHAGSAEALSVLNQLTASLIEAR